MKADKEVGNNMLTMSGIFEHSEDKFMQCAGNDGRSLSSEGELLLRRSKATFERGFSREKAAKD